MDNCPIDVKRGTSSHNVKRETMPSAKRKYGDTGEDFAAKFFEDNGYTIVDRNFRIKNIGEIDLIVEKKRKLYFIEVKTRDVKHETYFPIQFSIDRKKRTNLRRICELYLLEAKNNREWQVDAIFIKREKDGQMTIDRLENILWEEYY